MNTILVAIGYYLPGTNGGGPVRTINSLTRNITSYRFKILTLNHDNKSAVPYPDIEQGNWYDIDGAQVRYLWPGELKASCLKSILNDIQYDLLYLNGIFHPLNVRLSWLHWCGQTPTSPVLLAPRGSLYPEAMSHKLSIAGR